MNESTTPQTSTALAGRDSSVLLERTRFDAWMAKRGTPPTLEHPQAWDAWQAAKAEKIEAESMISDLLGMLDEHATLAPGHHPREWIEWVNKAKALMRSNTEIGGSVRQIELL